MSEQKLFESAMTILRKNIGAEERGRFPLDWLSDLSKSQTGGLAGLWRRLPTDVRRDLMGRMEEEARKNFELDFTAIARFALEDGDAEVRKSAVQTLWECEDAKLIDRYLNLMENDPDAGVRACAASALGLFVEQAELEKIPASIERTLADRLIAVIRGGDGLEVRRKAVEALGFSAGPEVVEILSKAYRQTEESMRCSALLAMGRSADSRWSEVVMAELRSSFPAMRDEAARAAGALELRRAVPQLIELLDDVDQKVRWSAIEALGEIGGEAARGALERLYFNAEGEETERIEAALENAEFQDSLGELPLLELDEDNELEEDDAIEEGREE
jgi:HEAT repeat protein